MLMSLEEQGCYLRMLCIQWEHGHVERRHLRGLLAKSEYEIDQLLKGTIGECFEETDEGHLVNPRLRDERQGAADLIEKRRQAGRARARKANQGPTSASAQHSSAIADAEAEAEAEYRRAKRGGKRRNAADELRFAVTDWERLNGPMPSALLQALEEYLATRKDMRAPLWTREMWMKNLAGGFTPGELAEAFNLASRSGWKSVHPKKKGASAPTPGQINGNAFKQLMEDTREQE